MNELVSVIIPTFKRSGTLERAIASVRAQTYKNIEILVVDDNDPDSRYRKETEALISGLLKDGARITYLKHDHNKGGAVARNTGIDNAKGEYVAFLDDDDIWMPDKIKKQLDMMDGFDAVCTACLFFGNGALSGKTFGFGKTSVSLADLRRRNNLGYTSSLIAGSHVFKKVRFDGDLTKYQDWDLFIRILKEGFRVGFVNEPLVMIADDFDRGRISTSIQSAGPEKLERFASIFEKHKDFFGPWYYNYHTAMCLLSYVGMKKGKPGIISYAVSKTGMPAVICVIFEKIWRRVTKTGFQI